MSETFLFAEERTSAPSSLDDYNSESQQTCGQDSAYSRLRVVYRSIDSLIPHERNSRTHSKRQIRKLMESIVAFGFTNPILINRAGKIIAGHGRVLAAKQLGMTEVPTICLDTLTPDQIRAYMIADNKLALDAGWDQDLLKIEILHLSSLPDLDVSLTGFEIPEIDLIIGSPSVEEDPDDQIEPLANEAITQPGDLWLLSDHRIYCGDARDEASYAALMGGRRASVIFTDPPFNVKIEGNVSGKGAVKHTDFAMASGEMSFAEFTEFLATTLGHLAHNSTNGSIHFVCMDFRHMRELLTAGNGVYDSLFNLCVWAKENGGQGSFYRSQHELVFVFKNGKGKHRNNIQLGRHGRYRTNVWKYPGVRGLSQQQGDEGNLLAMHPTVKPVAMVADAILDCSAKGEIVLDSFLGAGSTLLAAERTRRICYGMEIDGRYLDVAIRRWQRLTGEHAVHAESGVRFGARSPREVSCG
jgi:DNA modification methylase